MQAPSGPQRQIRLKYWFRFRVGAASWRGIHVIISTVVFVAGFTPRPWGPAPTPTMARRPPVAPSITETVSSRWFVT
jgi:hypothetical protein